MWRSHFRVQRSTRVIMTQRRCNENIVIVTLYFARRDASAGVLSSTFFALALRRDNTGVSAMKHSSFQD